MSTNAAPRIDLGKYIEFVDVLETCEVSGRITEAVGLLLRAAVPGARLGEICAVRSPHRAQALRAEVVGFRAGEALLMPLGSSQDIALGSEVVRTNSPLRVACGTQDLLTPLRHNQKLADAIDGAELVTLEGAGHMIPFERHADVTRVVEDVLAATGASVREGDR